MNYDPSFIQLMASAIAEARRRQEQNQLARQIDKYFKSLLQSPPTMGTAETMEASVPSGFRGTGRGDLASIISFFRGLFGGGEVVRPRYGLPVSRATGLPIY